MRRKTAEKSLDPLENALIVLRRRPRSPDAWVEVLNSTRTATVSWLIRGLGLGWHDAEDCYQDAVARTLLAHVAGRPPAFPNARALIGYIMRAGLNQAISLQRRDGRRRRAMVRLREMHQAAAAGTEDGEEPAAIPMSDWVRLSIRDLPPRMRKTLELRLSGQSHRRIARKLNIREGYVRVLLHRAIRRLRDLTPP